MKPIYIFLIGAVFFVSCGNQPKKGGVQELTGPLFDLTAMPEEPLFDMETTKGTMRIKLFKETPRHRDNFMKLAADRYYDGILFHRVIKGFMIQAGETGETPTPVQEMYGGPTGVDYTIPAEIVPHFTHKRGTLAAARQGDAVNPEKASSGSQFYIVHTDSGAKHLDGDYTIYGEVIAGLEVIDAIANEPVSSSRPTNEVKIISITPVY